MKLPSPIRPLRGAAGLLIAALGAFAALMLIMSLSQTQLLFPTDAVPGAGPLPPGGEQLELETPDGDKLQGVYLPPATGDGEGMLVLGFGGNAWNGQHVASELRRLFPEVHVVAFHYRGYRPSSGTPSAEALIEDAPRVYDAAVERVRPRRVVAVGFSIGSGVAAHLASERDLEGLILVTPFDSLKSVASDLYPWLPVGPFFQHEMDAAGALQHNGVPVAIIAADRDEIISAKRTQALREVVPNMVFDRTVAGAGHNDIYGRTEFEKGMREALSAIVASRK
ncbi:MAG TPA: alpha/beta hydrolase [Sphingomicrobium sp.]|nr:alpha/beta hydrolase [Sphingomicrobium sp.]